MDKIIPISDLQAAAKKYVDQVKNTDEPIIITQRGRAAAVLMKYESYEGHILTQEEMGNSDWKARLALVQKESARTKGIDLDKYLKGRSRPSRLKKAG
jgi:prevent-host-death family protein